MINKRGLSPAEFESIDDSLFEYLMVFDSYIEPSGVKMDMLHHAHLCQTITLNNPNITRDIAKSIKTTDYDYLGILDEGTTKERMDARTKKAEEAKKANNKAYFESRRKSLEGTNNGKK